MSFLPRGPRHEFLSPPEGFGLLPDRLLPVSFPVCFFRISTCDIFLPPKVRTLRADESFLLAFPPLIDKHLRFSSTLF